MEGWKDGRMEGWKDGSPPCPIQSFDGRFRLGGLRSRDWLPPSPGAVLLEFGVAHGALAIEANTVFLGIGEAPVGARASPRADGDARANNVGRASSPVTGVWTFIASSFGIQRRRRDIKIA